MIDLVLAFAFARDATLVSPVCLVEKRAAREMSDAMSWFCAATIPSRECPPFAKSGSQRRAPLSPNQTCEKLWTLPSAKYAVREVRVQLPDCRFVLRTDVRCYASREKRLRTCTAEARGPAGGSTATYPLEARTPDASWYIQLALEQ